MRTETIKFSDFMAGENKQKSHKKINKYSVTIPVALMPFGMTKAFAEPQVVPTNAMSDAIRGKIAGSFDPLVELMTAVSLPIASVMVTGGALMVMIGMNDKGYSLLMKASIGYVLVQMAPLFIDLLAGVGEAI